LAMTAANRDPRVFGADADQFVPGRPLPERVAPWGLSFGSGTHACLGAALAGGLPVSDEIPGEQHLFGAIVTMAARLFVHGARPHPSKPPVRDVRTTRPNFSSYWVTLDPEESSAL
jgi:hypothetical protein